MIRNYLLRLHKAIASGAIMKIFINLFLCFILFKCIWAYSNNSSSCNCYILGTIGSIKGESICNNKSKQCRCHDNVVGKNCDRCKDGYYGILSGHGCSACNCDSMGSNNSFCNQQTGQCSCKPSYTGLRCNMCAYKHYLTNRRCVHCKCSKFGSKHQQCDVDGICPCLSTFEGKLCDTCKENMYNVKAGCIACPPCYNIFKLQHTKYKRHINEITKNIYNEECKLPTYIVEYERFFEQTYELLNKTHLVEVKTYEILNASNIVDYLFRLKTKSKSIHDSCLLLLENYQLGFSYKLFKNRLFKIYPDFKEASILLVECEKEFKNANILSYRLGRYNRTITNIAKVALETVEKIEERVANIENTSSNETIQICEEACIANESFNNTFQEIESLLKTLKNETQIQSKRALSVSENVRTLHNKTKVEQHSAIKINEQLENINILKSNDIFLNYSQIKQNLSYFKERSKNRTYWLDTIKTQVKDLNIVLYEGEKTQSKLNENAKNMNDYEKRSIVAVNKTDAFVNNFNIIVHLYEEYQKVKAVVTKNVSDVRKTIDVIIQNDDKLRSMFSNMHNTIKKIQDLKSQLFIITNKIETESITVEHNSKIVMELEKQEIQIFQELEQYKLQLKDINRNISLLQKQQNEHEINLKILQEYLMILDVLPTTKEELDNIENEINKLENMVTTIDILKKEKAKLTKEVKNIKEIIENLPENANKLCESSQIEPKLNES